MNFPQEFKQTLKYQLAPYPYIIFPAYRLLAPGKIRDLLVSKKTELVVEGFPRSGNTFAVVAFQYAQPVKVKLAHHLHNELQILMGVKWSLPVLVLIREPVSAVRSLFVRHPDIDPNFALKKYIRFYEIVNKVKNQVVVANFDDVTADFGKVIKLVNAKFGTDFAVFQHNASNVERVFQRIESLNEYADGGKETHVARPSVVRQRTYQDLNISISTSLQEEAISIYQHVNRVAV